MPLPAWAIYAGVSAGVSGLRYITRKKPRRFEDTEYYKRLTEVSEEGAITPKARRLLIGKTSATAGAIAQRRKAEVRGELEAGGIGAGSVAGIRATTEPVLEQMRQVSETTRAIDLEQERSKVVAKEELARMSTMSEERRAEFERQAKTELHRGLIGAAGAGMQGYISERQLKIDKIRAEAMYKYYNRGEGAPTPSGELREKIALLKDKWGQGLTTPEEESFLLKLGEISAEDLPGRAVGLPKPLTPSEDLAERREQRRIYEDDRDFALDQKVKARELTEEQAQRYKDFDDEYVARIDKIRKELTDIAISEKKLDKRFEKSREEIAFEAEQLTFIDKVIHYGDNPDYMELLFQKYIAIMDQYYITENIPEVNTLKEAMYKIQELMKSGKGKLRRDVHTVTMPLPIKR